MYIHRQGYRLIKLRHISDIQRRRIIIEYSELEI
jgi:hypothetical protein